jgi:hypothetical protein
MAAETLLALIRSDFNPTALPQLPDERLWDEVFRLSIDTRVFPQLYRSVREILPESLRTVYQDELEKHHVHVRVCEQALGAFASTAAENNLRFVLFKGLGLSQVVYQDHRVRQLGDIDILVERDDVAKCDYVLRTAGFFQPDWTRGQNKIGSKQVRHFLRLQDKNSIPFPLHRWAHDVQLAPYYYRELPIRLEVHDGMHFVPQQEIGRMAWLTQTVAINGLAIRTFNNEMTFVELLLNAYENSETFYACRDGELNLRDYVDIAAFLASPENRLDWRAVSEILSCLQVEKIARVVSSNFREVYGSEMPGIEDALPRSSQQAPGNKSFLARLFDRALCADEAKQQIRDACKRTQGRTIKPARRLSECSDGDGMQWQIYPNSNGLSIFHAVCWDTSGLHLFWKLPAVFLYDIGHFRLQIGIIPSKETEYLEYMTFISMDSQGAVVAFMPSHLRGRLRFDGSRVGRTRRQLRRVGRACRLLRCALVRAR